MANRKYTDPEHVSGMFPHTIVFNTKKSDLAFLSDYSII